MLYGLIGLGLMGAGLIWWGSHQRDSEISIEEVKEGSQEEIQATLEILEELQKTIKEKITELEKAKNKEE